MPELPEVEVLVRHLKPLLKGKTVRAVDVRRPKIIAPTTIPEFVECLQGCRFVDVVRRGKYLLFALSKGRLIEPLTMVGHLGMTGRMYLLPTKAPLPKHTAVVMSLGRERFVFEDTRYFGRLTLDSSAVEKLGPEPLSDQFTIEVFAESLKRSGQPIKPKLLDQSLIAGVGNIYASEALFRASISPRMAARRLKPPQVVRLWKAIREVLVEAIAGGSTVPLNFAGAGKKDGLYYFGRAPRSPSYYEERLRVYDREGHPCVCCGTEIRRLVQAARSTYYCPACQGGLKKRRESV